MSRTLVLLVLCIVAVASPIVFAIETGIGISFEIADTEGPLVFLSSPLNKSGQQSNITLIFSVSDAGVVSNCTLFINDILNQTMASPPKDTSLRFFVNSSTPGKYNWSIHCTDSLAFPSNSTTSAFYVFYPILFNGSTTNLSTVNIENITNLIFEQQPYGKINFSQSVDLSGTLNLHAAINISPNFISANSEQYPQLSKSATLSLYSLSFSNPRILRNGQVCSVCTSISYSQGTLIFSVAQLSNYSAEETPVSPAPPGGGGSTGGSSGGGGGTGFLMPANTTTNDTSIVGNNASEGIGNPPLNESTSSEKIPFIESPLPPHLLEIRNQVSTYIRTHPETLTYGIVTLILLLGLHLWYIGYFFNHYKKRGREKRLSSSIHSPEDNQLSGLEKPQKEK